MVVICITPLKNKKSTSAKMLSDSEAVCLHSCVRFSPFCFSITSIGSLQIALSVTQIYLENKFYITTTLIKTHFRKTFKRPLAQWDNSASPFSSREAHAFYNCFEICSKTSFLCLKSWDVDYYDTVRTLLSTSIYHLACKSI